MHHLGSNTAVGYPENVEKLYFPNSPIDEISKVLHLIDHWASTLFSLRRVGISSIRGVNYSFAHELRHSVFDVARDVYLQIRSAPSGTHKTAVRFAVVQIIAKLPLFRLCSNIHGLMVCVRSYVAIMIDPSRCHIGATSEAYTRIQD